MLEIAIGQVLFSATARVFTRRCATPIVLRMILRIRVLLNVPRVEDQADYLSHGAATSGRAVSMATVSGQTTCVKPGGVGLSFHIESGPGAGVEQPHSP